MTIRRRGCELENVLIDVAEEILLHGNYGDFTFENIAAKAKTSRSVVYRRWNTKAEVIMAVLQRIFIEEKDDLKIVDTGSLRGDLINYLHTFLRVKAKRFTQELELMFLYHQETKIPLYQIREKMLSVTPATHNIPKIIELAARRKNLKYPEMPDYLIELPSWLVIRRLVLKSESVDEIDIEKLVDDVVLPVYKNYLKIT